MKNFVRRPFISGVVLSVPLWVVFNNYIVALSVALLSAFLLSMGYSLWLMSRGQDPLENAVAAEPDATKASAPSQADGVLSHPAAQAAGSPATDPAASLNAPADTQRN